MLKYGKYFLKEDFNSKEYIEVTVDEKDYQVKEVKGNILEVFPLAPVDNYLGSPRKWRETMLKLTKEERSAFLFKTLGFDPFINTEINYADKFDIDTAKKLDYFVTVESDDYISYYREPNVKNMDPLALLNSMYDECKRRNNEESE